MWRHIADDLVQVCRQLLPPILCSVTLKDACAAVQTRRRAALAAPERHSGRQGVDEETDHPLDYGDIVLHLFQPEAREMYDLEGLWADAPRIDWHDVLGIDKNRGL